MIEARGITRRFGRLTAVRDLDLEVPAGVVCGLLGPNGAGKTTTIRMVAGMLPPDRGELRVAGQSMPQGRRKALSRLGYLPESAPSNPEMRVSEYLRFRGDLLGLGRSRRRKAISDSLEACDLGGVERRLIGQLSKGFRQRVGLAASLLGDPELLVLDEPTVGLDPRQLRDFRSLIRRLAEQRTILISSHIMQEIEAVADRVVLMNRGRKLADDTIDTFRLAGERGGRTIARVEVPGAEDPASVLRRAAGSLIEATDDVRVETLSARVAEIEIPGVDRTTELGRVLAGSRLVPLRLDFERPGIEEVFLDLLERDPRSASEAEVVS
ncbi:MAG: ABC transporter ATP-binding protein [Phycisphaera sp.]|nr:ABC transporter ATP-binding protein [Phycisphaera sp.]